MTIRAIILLLTLLCFKSGFTQDSLSLTVNLIPFKTPINNFDTTYNFLCTLGVPDTNNIKKIHVKIGTHYDMSDILEYSFEYDVDAGLPAGLDYQRSDKYLTLTLGSRTMSQYYMQIRIEDTLSNLSNAIFWTTD